ncbi:MAG: sterol desaturase family protein [Alphaproteobacteria bacterium]
MDDLAYGLRDKRGDWRPKDPIAPAPLLAFPPRPLAILRWLPHYVLPWAALFFAIAAAFWFWLTPDIATMKTLSAGWIAWLLVRNMVAVLLFYGAFELPLYLRRAQGGQFRYNARWPADNRSDVFLFRSQTVDNMIRTFGFGVPIWTAYEVLILWAFANGWGNWVSWSDNAVWLVAFALLIPMLHDLHFFCIHRLIHTPWLYRRVHAVHHNSVNPSPWSSLSMHPVEHLLYWSGALIHLVVPSHPLLALFHIYVAGFGAVVGHIGFDRIVVGRLAIPTHAFAHYLHHKYFEVNYSDGGIPLDKWCGSWHDGTKAGDALMDARMQEKRARLMTAAGRS